MKSTTAKILKGFSDEMKADGVGWNEEVIGQELYHLFRLLENSLDIPSDIIIRPKK